MKYSHSSDKAPRGVLLFDFGTILIGLSKEKCIAALEKIGCGKIAYYVDECRQEDLFHELEIGGSIEAFCEEARRQSSFTDENGTEHPCLATDEEICWAWNELLLTIPVEKLRMIKHLHDDLGYRTAILSNTNYIHWNYSLEHIFTADGLTIDDYFDDIFLSCDLQMVKPDACIYEETAKRLGVEPSEIFFIDDSRKNIDAAIAAGYHGLHDPKGDKWMYRLSLLDEANDLFSLHDRKGKAAIIGNFDGVHEGHQYVMKRLVELCAKHDLEPLVITFDQHPRALFDKTFTPKYLTTQEEKRQLLRETLSAFCGEVEAVNGNAVNEVGLINKNPDKEASAMSPQVCILPFNRSLASLSAREFMERVLKEQMNVELLLLGYDNRIGKRNEEEDSENYREYGKELGMRVIIANPLDVDSTRVSSSHIRHLVAEGDMQSVSKCLGRDYSLTGIVEKGYQEGRKIGFPTANISVASDKLLPGNGVYATQITICNPAAVDKLEATTDKLEATTDKIEATADETTGCTSYKCITNIGTRPTYGEHAITVETHIPGFTGDLYGKTVTLRFIRKIREEQVFDSPETLREQIATDIAAAL